MPTGTVKFYNDVRGYGFIQQSGGADIFVHASALRESGIDMLREGDTVAYEIVPTRGGKTKATSLRLIEADGAGELLSGASVVAGEGNV